MAPKKSTAAEVKKPVTPTAGKANVKKGLTPTSTASSLTTKKGDSPKTTYFETKRGQLVLILLAAIFLALAVIMTTLYYVEVSKRYDIKIALGIMRDFAVAEDPRFQKWTDVEVVVLAQNLSLELLKSVGRNDELQAEIEKLLGMLGEWVLYNKNLYYFSKDEVTWPESITQCAKRTSELVSVKYGEEQAFADQEATHLDNSYWIGLWRNRSLAIGVEWLNRQKASTSYWDVGQPRGDGNCIYIGPRCRIKFCWRNNPCTNKKRYLCKKEPNPFWYII